MLRIIHFSHYYFLRLFLLSSISFYLTRASDSPIEEDSVGSFDNSASSMSPCNTLEPEYVEPIKEYHLPYPFPRGRDLREKYGMSKDKKGVNDSQENHSIIAEDKSLSIYATANSVCIDEVNDVVEEELAMEISG